jgi:hypothetical protein
LLHYYLPYFLDWQPTDEYGRNYYWLKFQQDPNSSVPIDWPHMIMGEFFRPKETNFWMEILKEVNNGEQSGEDTEWRGKFQVACS